MWTFTLIYSTYYTLKYNNGPISHIVVISNVWFGTDAQTIFPPMGAQITSIVFTPMRSELKKLNWSTYPLSRILSPFGIRKKVSVSVSVKILVSSISDCSECFNTAHDFCGPHFCMEWCTVHSRQRAGHRTDVVEKDLLPSQPSPTANLSLSTHIEKPLF